MAPTPVDTKSRLHDLPTPEPESPFPRARKPYRFSTLCATVENPDMKDQYGSSSVPIYQTATFKGVGNEYDYTRSGNPTRTHLRESRYHETLDVNLTRTHRTPSRQNLIGRPCIYRLFRNGGSRCHPADTKARRRGHRWRRPLRWNQPSSHLHSKARWRSRTPC